MSDAAPPARPSLRRGGRLTLPLAVIVVVIVGVGAAVVIHERHAPLTSAGASDALRSAPMVSRCKPYYRALICSWDTAHYPPSANVLGGPSGPPSWTLSVSPVSDPARYTPHDCEVAVHASSESVWVASIRSTASDGLPIPGSLGDEIVSTLRLPDSAFPSKVRC